MKIDPDVLAQLSGDERDKYLESIERHNDLAARIKMEELKLAQQQQKAQLEQKLGVSVVTATEYEASRQKQRDKYRGQGKIYTDIIAETGELHIRRRDQHIMISHEEAQHIREKFTDDEFLDYCHTRFDAMASTESVPGKAPPMPTKSKPFDPREYSVKLDAGVKSVSEWSDWSDWGEGSSSDKSQQPNNGPAWDPKKSRKREENMANKFLPFVVESSTPHHIFKTLLSRSKGMNKMLIASIFNLTLNVDIKKLREVVKEYPDMQVDKLYEELMTKYPHYRVVEEELNDFIGLSKYLPKIKDDDNDPWLSEDLQTYPVNDALMFISVVLRSNLELSEYTSLDFTSLLDTRPVMEKIDNFIILADKDEKSLTLTVNDQKDLKLAVLFYALFWYQFQPGDQTIRPIITFKMKDQS